MRLISILMALFLFLNPAVGAKEEAPVLCLFISSDLRFNYEDFPHPVALKVIASDWSKLDDFLTKASEISKTRKVILDFSVHGLGEPPLYLVANDKHSYVATAGGIINHIERIIPENQIEAVVMESCYGAQAYSGTLHPSRQFVRKIRGCLLENRGAGDPKWPIYGFNGFRNVPPCGIEQYLHKEMLTLQDLRGLAPVTLSKQTEEVSVLLQRIILDQCLKKDSVFRMKIFY